MLWKGRRESGNVEDVRGGGGMGGTGLALGGGGCGTLIIIILALLFGVDPRTLLNQGQSPAQTSAPTSQTQGQRQVGRGDDELAQFARVVLADTEDFWTAELRKAGKQYRKPTLVLFSRKIQSGCGVAGASSGPFYCPSDQKLYIDLSFYRELSQKLGAPGDFAQAYVLAHEVGHHIQNLQGITDQVDAQRARMSESQYNQLSVRLELQADCYAGMFARNEQQKGVLEAGDLQEALRAASAVGDDRLQSEFQGYVVPDSFTHGTSEQRSRWFNTGFQSGDLRQCNTFASKSL